MQLVIFPEATGEPRMIWLFLIRLPANYEYFNQLPFMKQLTGLNDSVILHQAARKPLMIKLVTFRQAIDRPHIYSVILHKPIISLLP